MTQAERLASKWIAEAIEERVGDIVERWKNSDTTEDREACHVDYIATIGLEDKLNARIERTAAE